MEQFAYAGGSRPSVGASRSSLRTFRYSMIARRSSGDRYGPIRPFFGAPQSGALTYSRLNS